MNELMREPYYGALDDWFYFQQEYAEAIQVFSSKAEALKDALKSCRITPQEYWILRKTYGNSSR